MGFLPKASVLVHFVLLVSLLNMASAFFVSPSRSRRLVRQCLTIRSCSSSLRRRHLPPRLFSSRLFSTVSDNQELVQQGIDMARAKKHARENSTLAKVQRNFKLKQIIETNNHDDLIAIRVSACPILRRELKLNGREKRGRMFVETTSKATFNLSLLKQELHGFFRSLKKNTYLLQASLPHQEESWSIETNQHVMTTFQKAQEYFEQQNDTVLKRPTLLLHVIKDPKAPIPQVPSYLQNLPNPKESPTMTMLSFYAFDRIDNPHEFGISLRQKFKPFNALGRIYVSPTEGINAQMSVPTNVLLEFQQCCESIPQLQNMENGINVDPIAIPSEEFFTDNPPFPNLHVRVRTKIVADGLDHALDWSNAGYDMPPMEWHQALSSTKEPLVLDCRNSYESSVGHFEGAQPLETETFRDSWDALKSKLQHVPKHEPIYTYCTGGIRCVKVGAFLKQEMNFTNVNRLAGGIIAYDRTLQEEQDQKKSLFQGTNFVFDGRLSRRITQEALGICHSCQSKTNLVSNCQNPNCHLRMVQCETCRTKHHGTCCEACKIRILQGNNNKMESTMTPTRAVLAEKNNNQNKNEIKQDQVQTTFHSLEEYSMGHSTPVPDFYKEMEFNTRAYLPSGSHMVSGRAQGQFLQFLASMTRHGRILEIGTFTGYATACLVQGAAAAACASHQGGGPEGGPYVLSMERDARAINLAVAHLQIMSRFGNVQGNAVAEAACQLRNNTEMKVPQVQGDSFTMTYQDRVGCEVLRVTDALATLEEMTTKHNDNTKLQQPFDMVFVDADKTRLLDYVEACVSNDNVLKKGGLIVVDNVLWKGLVLQAANGSGGDQVDSAWEEVGDEKQQKRGRRARKLAMKMHRFNSAIVQDNRVEVMVLPMRDGLSVIRKR